MKGSKAIPQEEKPTIRGKLLTVAEAAEYVRHKKTWMYERVTNGRIPGIPPDPILGGKWLVDSAVLDDLLHRRIISAGSIPGTI